jgi:hypothetical protein
MLQSKQDPDVDIRWHIIWVDFKNLPILRDRGVRVSNRFKCDGEIEACMEIVWIEGQRFTKSIDSGCK